MPSFVIMEKCDGCKGLDKTACQHICPNDLMVLNKETMKAFNAGSRDVLGMLQLREALPAAGDRRPRLRGFRSPGSLGECPCAAPIPSCGRSSSVMD